MLLSFSEVLEFTWLGTVNSMLYVLLQICSQNGLVGSNDPPSQRTGLHALFESLAVKFLFINVSALHVINCWYEQSRKSRKEKVSCYLLEFK